MYIFCEDSFMWPIKCTANRLSGVNTLTVCKKLSYHIRELIHEAAHVFKSPACTSFQLPLAALSFSCNTVSDSSDSNTCIYACHNGSSHHIYLSFPDRINNCCILQRCPVNIMVSFVKTILGNFKLLIFYILHERHR